GISLQPVPRNRYQITFMDVPVKTQVPVERPELLRRQSHRRRDAEHLHHGIRLVQKMRLPARRRARVQISMTFGSSERRFFPRNSFLTNAVLEGSLMDELAFANACMLTKLW